MRILLVEDERDLGQALRQALTHAGYIVDWALGGDEAWEFLVAPHIEYSAGIFDWLVPNLSGLDLVKRLRARAMNLPVLILSARDSINDRILGLDAGADDYLIKPFGIPELLARLRALQRRSPYFQPQQLTLGDLNLDYVTNTVCIGCCATNDCQSLTLTAKEFQLLEYFMQHPEQIVSRDRLLSQIWTADAEPVSNVVAAQIRLLRRKLAQISSQASIETVYGLGYRFHAAAEA